MGKPSIDELLSEKPSVDELLSKPSVDELLSGTAAETLPAPPDLKQTQPPYTGIGETSRISPATTAKGVSPAASPELFYNKEELDKFVKQYGLTQKQGLPWWDKLGFFARVGKQAKINAYSQTLLGEASAKIAGKVATEVARPYNVLWQSLQDAAALARIGTQYAFLRPHPGTPIQKRLLGEAITTVKKYPDRVVDAWNLDPITSPLDTVMTGAMSQDDLEIFKANLSEKRIIGKVYTGVDLASMLAGDVFIDYLLFGVGGRAATRALSLRSARFARAAQALAPTKYAKAWKGHPMIGKMVLGKESWAKQFSRTSDYLVRQGYDSVIYDTIKRSVTPNIDEFIAQSLLKPKAGFQAGPRYIAGGKAYLDVAGNVVSRELPISKFYMNLLDQIDDAAKNVDNLTKNLDDITKEKARLSTLADDMGFNKQKTVEDIYDQFGHPIVEQAVDIPTRTNIEYSLLDELDTLSRAEEMITEALPRAQIWKQMVDSKRVSMLNGSFIDYETITRSAREAYIDRLVNLPKSAGVIAKKKGISLSKTIRTYKKTGITKTYLHGTKELRTAIKADIIKAIEAVSDGRVVNYSLEKLTDDEFLALFDYINVYTSAPESFHKWAGFLTKEWYKHPNPPLPQIFAPFRYWMHRKGLRQIPDVVEHADMMQTREALRFKDEWDEVIDGWKKVFKRKPEEKDFKRLFDLAENQQAAYDDVVKSFTPSQLTADRVVADQWISLRDYYGSKFKAQGKFSDAIPEIEDYVTWFTKKVEDIPISEEFRLNRFVETLNRRRPKAMDKITVPILKKRVRHIAPELKNLESAYVDYLNYAAWNSNMEPALRKAKTLASLTGDKIVIDKTTNWINYAIRGLPTKYETWTDYHISNRLMDAVETGTKWLPERMRIKAQVRSTKQLLTAWRRATYSGAMINPTPMANNILQNIMNIAPTNVNSWGHGVKSMFTEGGQELAEKHNTLLLQRMPLEGFTVTDLTKVEKWGTAGFRLADRWNVTVGFNGAAYHFVKRGGDTNLKILRRFADISSWRDTDNVMKAISDAMSAGLFKAEKQWANDLIRTTQYIYKPFGLPPYMFGQIGRSMGQFTTWPSNYFYSYLPQMVEMTVTGKAPWGTLTGMERHALLRHFLWAETIVTAGGIMGFDMKKQKTPGPHLFGDKFTLVSGAMPMGAPPLPTFLEGLTRGILFGILGGSDREKQIGWSKIKSGTTFAPPILAGKLWKVGTGEKPARTILLPVLEEDSSWDYKPRRPSRPRR